MTTTMSTTTMSSTTSTNTGLLTYFSLIAFFPFAGLFLNIFTPGVGMAFIYYWFHTFIRVKLSV